jgi:hypothetical protein
MLASLRSCVTAAKIQPIKPSKGGKPPRHGDIHDRAPGEQQQHEHTSLSLEPARRHGCIIGIRD